MDIELKPYAMLPNLPSEYEADRFSAVGPSRHFAAAQQPRRFRSKADINFVASRHRVYEYTA
jgi:hypothetical protein